MTQFDSEVQSHAGLLHDDEGKYRWIYQQPMLKSFFLLFEVWKVIIAATVIVFLLVTVIGLVSGNGLSAVAVSLETGLLVLAILLVLSIPAYYIVTKVNYGMYTVLFEMDDSGIDHIQIKTEESRALDMLVSFVGIEFHDRTTTAAGLLSASGNSLYSRFADVRKIKAVRERNMIIVNGTFLRNQVYVDPQNYDFVYDYIVRHCPDARIV